MERFEQQLEKYAELVVKMGINVQPGQTLVVTASLEEAPFVRKVVKQAYEVGAKDVYVDWIDDEVRRIRLQDAPFESLKEVQPWKVSGFEQMAEEGAGFLSVYAPNPDLLNDVDGERFATAHRAGQTAMHKFREYIQNDRVSWSVVSVATEPWAKSLFPGEEINIAMEELWDLIFMATRVSEDNPVAAWQAHIQDLQARLEYLNTNKFKKLHYKAPGTDLTIELPAGHKWLGGGAKTTGGVFFLPNMPTEEVFTVPLKTGVNGVVSSTKPLDFGGKLIENFSLTFENGRIVDVKAEQGYETLKSLVESDEGSHYLGEVALVPHDSPISNAGVVFKNTLFDENASNHIAIGSAYPTCLEGGEAMSRDELEKLGVNSSVTHEDFMIGSQHMDIDAETADGQRVPLFRNGNWV